MIGRRDRILLAGLTFALIVAFSKQVHSLLDFVRDIERSSGVTLILPLIILTVFVVIHQQGKRHAANARAAAAEAASQEALGRAAELERLMTFGQALGRSLDHDAIRDVALQHLDRLIGTQDARVVARVAGHWQMLVGSNPAAGEDSGDLIQTLTDRAVRDRANRWEVLPIAADKSSWWPMTAGGDLVGFLGVPEAGWEPDLAQSRMVATAATLLGVSLRNADLFREVRDSSLKDGLTGCFNRTHALEVIDTELRRARRSRLPVSLIMFDIDRFKAINDQYGHLCGDAVLAAVGTCMREVLRGSDLKCRYGGEEFLVLLPDTPMEGALQVADTLRRELSQRKVTWNLQSVSITASFGVALAKPAEVDARVFIGRADTALYRAKEQGRNRVCSSSEPAVA